VSPRVGELRARVLDVAQGEVLVLEFAAFAITTATYGRNTAATMSTQRSHPSPTATAPMKHAVRMAIETM
jgi:hypothetical protein